MTIIRRNHADIRTPRSVREHEAAFEHQTADCSDIPEITEEEFGQAVRLGPGTRRSLSQGAILEIYKDKSGQYRWRLIASNGSILAVSAGGYESRQICMNHIGAMRAALAELGS